MDWSKAKVILICALSATCIMLSCLLAGDAIKENSLLRASTKNAVDYMKSEGASSICDIPLGRPKMPVLFIVFENESSGSRALEVFDGYEVAVSGGSGVKPVMTSAGKSKAKIVSAGSGLLNLITRVDTLQGLSVDSVKLVYYIDASSATEGLQDTAMPAWKFETNKGEFFINAYGQ